MSAASDACPRLEYDRRVSEASASSAGDSSNSKDATWTEKNGRYAHPDASAGADAPALGEEAGFSTLERLVSLVGQADEPPCVPVPLAGLDAAAETGDSTRMGDGPAVLPRAKLIILGVGAMFTFFLAVRPPAVPSTNPGKLSARIRVDGYRPFPPRRPPLSSLRSRPISASPPFRHNGFSAPIRSHTAAACSSRAAWRTSTVGASSTSSASASTWS